MPTTLAAGCARASMCAGDGMKQTSAETAETFNLKHCSSRGRVRTVPGLCRSVAGGLLGLLRQLVLRLFKVTPARCSTQVPEFAVPNHLRPKEGSRVQDCTCVILHSLLTYSVHVDVPIPKSRPASWGLLRLSGARHLQA